MKTNFYKLSVDYLEDAYKYLCNPENLKKVLTDNIEHNAFISAVNLTFNHFFTEQYIIAGIKVKQMTNTFGGNIIVDIIFTKSEVLDGVLLVDMRLLLNNVKSLVTQGSGKSNLIEHTELLEFVEETKIIDNKISLFIDEIYSQKIYSKYVQ